MHFHKKNFPDMQLFNSWISKITHENSSVLFITIFCTLNICWDCAFIAIFTF